MPRTRIRRSRAWLTESLWTADLILIGMFVFFIVLGAISPFDSVVLAIILAVLVGLWILHALTLRRRGGMLTPEDRRARERRGF